MLVEFLEANKITGGCLCGAIRYEVRAAPIVTRICWCRDCQYLGAGSTTVNICFPSNATRIVNAENLTTFRNLADSGNAMNRRFCATCGTPVFSEAEMRPHLIFIRVGTLDDPSIAEPAMNIWTSKAPRWACMDPTLPAFTGQPPPAA